MSIAQIASTATTPWRRSPSTAALYRHDVGADFIHTPCLRRARPDESGSASFTFSETFKVELSASSVGLLGLRHELNHFVSASCVGLLGLRHELNHFVSASCVDSQFPVDPALRAGPSPGGSRRYSQFPVDPALRAGPSPGRSRRYSQFPADPASRVPRPVARAATESRPRDRPGASARRAAASRGQNATTL